ncbi:GNAT family N-acetyltransferase [Oceanispirochaeta sp. M1]|uniref:GNAT family N-acetyltransferase n=1 Tax=Oceanispirochaeta sp. M1 TaxID=2283433 RepID=UPI001313EA5F|nr:GNAT family N-acetyltransferase [Oceanispirochaeta sp. M1]NPD71862.1 GNAT family N-acetyltransferase [Oceanispirochaeta sp. M1]
MIDSEKEGISFVSNTVEEWITGINRFDKKGEIFFGAFINAEIVGMGGLNIDPYTNLSSIGRVRHLYVCPKFRRQNIGKQLMLKIIKHAKKNYQGIRLYTENKEAFKFYESLGFQNSSKFKESHFLKL